MPWFLFPLPVWRYLNARWRIVACDKRLRKRLSAVVIANLQ
jgi:hypothetical protein